MSESDKDPEGSDTRKAYNWQNVHMLPNELKITFNATDIVYYHTKVADSCYFN